MRLLEKIQGVPKDAGMSAFYHFPPLPQQLFTQGPLPDRSINRRVDPTFQRLGVQQRQVWDDVSSQLGSAWCPANPAASSNGLASFFWLFDFHSCFQPQISYPQPLSSRTLPWLLGLVALQLKDKVPNTGGFVGVPLLLSVCLEGSIAPGGSSRVWRAD